MIYKFPIIIPTFDCDNNIWDEKSFQSREDFSAFVTSLLKEPGEYNFDESTKYWNINASYFKKNKKYEGNKYPELTKDRKLWWNKEKNKCRKGVIYYSNGNTFYVPRFYYDWLNFMQIYDKVKNDFDFPEIWDVHYDLSLCVVLSELNYQNLAVLKKRQIGSSLFFLALIINCFWFEKGAVLKLGASLSSFLGMEDGCWKTLDFYRSFRNQHTDWYRACNPDKVGNWIQQREVVTQDGKKSNIGRKSSIKATSFEKSPTNGVGGPCLYFFHEEGGIAPKADVTLGFMDPAMKVGLIRTGVFMIAGSVGELSQCKPLEKWIKNPGSEFFSRETSLLNDTGVKEKCGIFIPEQWGMPPYIDKYGNSLVEKALEAIEKDRIEFKEAIKKGEKSEEEYRLYVSQHPKNIKEAFDWREKSLFPTHLIQKQKDRILKGEVYREFLDIKRNEKGIPEFKATHRVPLKFPTEVNLPDKRGCLIVKERPATTNPPFGMYYGTVDPVNTGKTSNSESLFCIQIWKAPEEIIVSKDDKTFAEYKNATLVCSWTGRFDDLEATHEYASMIIEMYNAWTIVESNVKVFNQFMRFKKRLKYLVPASQIRGFKSDSIETGNDLEYGWLNIGTLFYDVLLQYGITGVKEIIGEEFKPDGEVVKRTYAVEEIVDEWLLEEMLQYRKGINVDRLVCYCAMLSFISLQVAHRGINKRVINKNLENNKNLYKFNVRTPFKNIGNFHLKNENPMYSLKKSNFKNLR